MRQEHVLGAQRVHVGIWYILRAQRGSHIPTLRPKYTPYSYMDPLGRSRQSRPLQTRASSLGGLQAPLRSTQRALWPMIYWGYIGIMEKKMETTIMGYIGYILGLYWDNGKENGSYYLGFRVSGE